MMVSVRRTGAACLEFIYEGKSWLIGPYLSQVGKIALFFGRTRTLALDEMLLERITEEAADAKMIQPALFQTMLLDSYRV